MSTPLLIACAMAMAGAACALFYFATRKPEGEVAIEARLAQFSDRQMTLEELELAQPFKQRVLIPMFVRFTHFFSRFTPAKNIEALQQMLIEAGSPSRLGVTEFLGLRLGLAAVGGGLVFLLSAISGASLTRMLMFPLVIALIGYIAPMYWLRKKVSTRRISIQKSLPDAIDLLTISVEAGLGFDPALHRVVAKWDNELTFEFGRMLQEMRYGKSRREAMREMSKRCGVDDLNVFVSSIVQADQLGVSITQVLRTQSRQLRQRRRQRAEEAAHKAPIKMLFPMALLIFPALYAVILGPAVPRLMGGGGL